MATLVSVKSTGSTGNSVSARRMFTAVFEGKPSNEDIQQAQQKAGYHPAGYGGPSVTKEKRISDNQWEVDFWCYASCD